MVALANTSIISHNYHFFFVVTTCKIYTLSSFQIYSTVLYCIYGTIYILYIYMTSYSICLSFSDLSHLANVLKGGSLVAQIVKNLPAMQETWIRPLGQGDTLEKGMAIHSSILAWRIPWTEEPGGHSPCGCKELDTTDRLTLSISFIFSVVKDHQFGCICQYFGLMPEIIFCCINIRYIFFNHSYMNRHLGYFHSLAIIDDVAMNMRIHISLRSCFYFLWIFLDLMVVLFFF